MASSSSSEGLDLLQDDKKDESQSDKNPARASWSQRDKQILMELLETLNMEGATVKAALDKGISSNDKRHKVWAAVTKHFNLSTQRSDKPEQIRTLYNRMKTQAKNKHDKQVIASKAGKVFKKSCALTGGGPGISMPAEVDGDHYQDHFEAVLDPPPNPFATFNAPHSSREVFPTSEVEAAIQSIVPAAQQKPALASPTFNIEVQNMQDFGAAGDGYSNEFVIQEIITEEQLSVSNNQQASASVSNAHQVPVSNNHNMAQIQEDEQVDQTASVSNNHNIIMHTIDDEIGARRKGAASNPAVRRTESVSPVILGSRKTPQSTPRTGKGLSGKGAGANRKDEAATNFYRKTLKQRTSLAKYQKPTAKFKLNLNYMKCKLLENQLLESGFSFELPYKNVEIPSSDSDSDSDEDDS
jgi:hypothetical protein